MEFSVLEDFNLADKKVLLRVDINSPIDPHTRELLDDTRLRGHLPTIRSLSDSKIILLAHQSRPGLRDFTTLEMHARKIQELLGKEVKYTRDIFGQAARDEISALATGEILVLENVRFCSEEVSKAVMDMPPEEQAETNLVQRLSSYVDFYVNDAFAVSHRNQPSIVGFPVILPSCAGKLMEKEVSILSKVLNSQDRPRVFAFGGAKAGTALKIIKKVLDRGIADVILTSGVVANLFLFADGCDLGGVNRDFLAEKNIASLIPETRELLAEHGDKIKTPIDLAFQKKETRVEAPVEKYPNRKVLDIGIETIVHYSSIIKEAGVAVANGPCGVFELQPFALGTEELLRAIAESKAFAVVGGGHLAAIAKSINLSKSNTYVSTGGKATMAFLARNKLPGIEALKNKRRE
ncbi:MAG: phosphoglycerate kinase [Candidatus Hydrothermarchaeales archaeon]